MTIHRRHSSKVTGALLGMLALLSLAACAQAPTSVEALTRERAIDIARRQVAFEPTSVDAAVEGHVWLVTLRRADGSHGGLGQFAEISIDRSTGQVVRLAMS